jgi:hypothetical protein
MHNSLSPADSSANLISGGTEIYRIHTPIQQYNLPFPLFQVFLPSKREKTRVFFSFFTFPTVLRIVAAPQPPFVSVDRKPDPGLVENPYQWYEFYQKI